MGKAWSNLGIEISGGLLDVDKELWPPSQSPWIHLVEINGGPPLRGDGPPLTSIARTDSL